MKHSDLKKYLNNDFVSMIRVVPIPMRSGWCIDLLLKELFSAGARTETLESDRSTRSRPKLRRFASIDSAAQYLKSVGVTVFRVETDAALSTDQFNQIEKDETAAENDRPAERRNNIHNIAAVN